jgi:hypothetical protein
LSKQNKESLKIADVQEWIEQANQITEQFNPKDLSTSLCALAKLIVDHKLKFHLEPSFIKSCFLNAQSRIEDFEAQELLVLIHSLANLSMYCLSACLVLLLLLLLQARTSNSSWSAVYAQRTACKMSMIVHSTEFVPCVPAATAAGNNESQQLECIFKLMGAPSEQNWPGVSQLEL